MKQPRISSRKVDDLIPYAANSRTHDPEQIAQIAASIREFGFTNPILIDEDNGIIAGHGRLMGARLLEMEKVPCIVLAHLSEAQKKAYVIADNKLALNAGWDLEMLKAELEGLDALDFDLSLTGFDEDELAGLMGLDDDGKTDPDAVPVAPETPVSAPGDLWVMGQHRLICADAANVDAVVALMDGALADQLVTDPPYNVAYEGKTKKALKIQNDEMADGEFRQFLRDCYASADAVMKQGAVFYIWHADSEGLNFRGAAQDVGWEVRQCLIWKKQSMVLGRQDYQWQHEPCLYGWKAGSSHLWASDRKQTTVLEFDRPSRSEEHPTMKPVDLIEYQILNNTKASDIVLDLFGGSGTTLIAAQKTGRHARLVEIDPVYCDVIVQRWQEYTGETASLADNGDTFAKVAKARGVK